MIGPKNRKVILPRNTCISASRARYKNRFESRPVRCAGQSQTAPQTETSDVSQVEIKGAEIKAYFLEGFLFSGGRGPDVGSRYGWRDSTLARLVCDVRVLFEGRAKSAPYFCARNFKVQVNYSIVSPPLDDQIAGG